MTKDYSQSKVYKIWSPNGDKVYIGSTTKKYLSQRMTAHRCDYIRWKDKKRNFVSSFILFDEYGLNNCFIELLEAKSCASNDELKKLEGRYIREKSCVNKVIPDRGTKEWGNDNALYISEQFHKWYEVNKENCKEQQQQYREKNKQTISEYKKKKYMENKTDKLAYQHEYRKANKDQITAYRSLEVVCTCGKTIKKVNKSRHLTSLIHKEHIISTC